VYSPYGQISKQKCKIPTFDSFGGIVKSAAPIKLKLGKEKVNSFNRQEAQLSPRNRAIVRVTEYFAKSLKITQGHSK